MPNAKKPWTVLVWMAGDNDLEDFGLGDIKELKKVGSTNQFDVLVQLDRMHDDKTRRYHIRAGTPIEGDVVEELGETNTGDPTVAADFFTWGIKNYPAQRVLAVIWNHGSGIDETDVYRRAANRGIAVERHATPSPKSLPRSRARAIASRRYRRALFATTVDAAVSQRAIAYDDTSRDFLDNVELKKVLATVRQKTKRKIDLLGFDACLMNMLEVAYQLRTHADFIVGSEEVEPGDGWPYDKVLTDLMANPDLSPEKLGTAIVQRYVASYPGEDVTQSLLSNQRAAGLADAVDRLAGSLAKAISSPAEYAATTKAVNATQHYDVKDFVDLYDFCEQLKKRSKDQAVKRAADATMAAIAGDEPFVVAEKHKGGSVKRSHGVAIYFPRSGDVTVAYHRLDFAKSTRWDSFLKKYSSA